MAVLKVACRKCGQKVSGDETFYGSTVECPICSSDIVFPDHPPEFSTDAPSPPVPPSEAPLPLDDKAREVTHLPKAEFSSVTLPDDPPPARPPSPKTEAIPLTPRESKSGKSEPSPPPPSEPPPQAPEDDDEPPSPVLATVSMVIGILNFVFCFIPAFLFAPIGIICGHIALVRARHSRIQPAPGYGMAIAGLVLGYVSFLLFCVILLVAVVLKANFDFVPKPV